MIRRLFPLLSSSRTAYCRTAYCTRCRLFSSDTRGRMFDSITVPKSYSEALTVLNFPKNSSPTPTEINKAFRKSALSTHPDSNPNRSQGESASLPPSSFQNIVSAREILLTLPPPSTIPSSSSSSSPPLRPPTSLEDYAAYASHVRSKSENAIKDLLKRREDNIKSKGEGLRANRGGVGNRGGVNNLRGMEREGGEVGRERER